MAGYWGIAVTEQTYNASFYIRSGSKSRLYNINVSLRSNTTGKALISSKISAAGVSRSHYTQLATKLTPTAAAADVNNTFAITFDASEVAGSTIYFGLLSLFGETFNNRPNGMRKDLAQHIYDMKPKFLRFPGGNNLEGESIDGRWKWYETVGPIIDRPGRLGDWGYYNTDGFGLLEYIDWIEDMEMEPILAIYAGYSLDKSSVPESEMGWVLQEALDEIEYLTADASKSKLGALRAKHGHPEPVKLNYIEIGNEDWFSSTYPYRFPYLYNGIKKAYPNLKLIASAYDEAKTSFNYTIDLPKGSMWDTHHYEWPGYFTDAFDLYDNWQETTNNPDVEIIVGEYSLFSAIGPVNWTNTQTPVHVYYPEMISAVEEGIYLLGIERNPNVVKMTTWAPTLAHYKGYQWTPNVCFSPIELSRAPANYPL